MYQQVSVLILLSILLISCAQQTQIEQQEGNLLPDPTLRTKAHAQLLLSNAESLSQQEQQLNRLQAAFILSELGDFAQADTIHQQVDFKKLNTGEKAVFLLSKSMIEEGRNNITDALSSLNKHSSPDSLPISIQYELSNQKANLLLKLNKYLLSAKERVFINPLLEGKQKDDNNEATWITLSRLNESELENAIADNSDPNLNDWLKLAYINKAYQHDIEEQNLALQNWLNESDNQDLKKNLPETIRLIKDALKNRPKRIVFLLPESGIYAKSADAIKHGFFYQHFRTHNNGKFTPELYFINTSNEALEQRYRRQNPGHVDHDDEIENSDTNHQQAFLLAFQEALEFQPDLIIGPINKEHIETLAQQKIRIPTLSLNYIDSIADKPVRNLFQFGLSPEDEIQHIVEHTVSKNYEHAAILAPENAWGNRLAKAFEKAWESEGGKVVSHTTYGQKSSFSKTIESLLNIDMSEQRFKRLYWFSNGDTLFYSRRRQDIDFIYLIASPDDARQIMPTFSFHDAADLPVYSNSNVYSGEHNNKDKDLNRLYFSEIPAMFNGPQDVQSAWNNQDFRYRRLIAMGMDTYDLSIRLEILSSSSANTLFGKTGILHTNKSGKIIRKPVLARFIGSQIKIQADTY